MVLPSLILLTMRGSANPEFDAGPTPLLMRHPTVSQTTIVFQFAGDLWSVPRSGGSARRLTSAPGIESNPFFSPDGKTIAFSGRLDGNEDVFVVPAEGGIPKRLTYHPAPDVVAGWTPDGKSVVFSSSMTSNTDAERLFTVSVSGGVPKPLPFPMGTMASFSSDAQHLAYVPGFKWEDAWKRYRGGQAYSIWIAEMSDSKWKAIPKKNENDEQPMWVGDSVYYLSDKRGPVGMYRYDTKSGSVNEVIKGEGFDIKSATAGPGVIAYEKLGSVWLYDLASHQSKRVPIEIHGDFTEVRPQFKDLRRYISGVSISPSGQRALVAARGFVFSVPASKGDARIISEAQGPHRRDPAWSPEGKTIAFITDAENVQQLALVEASTGKERHVNLGNPPAYYESPVWSPDSKKVVYADNRNTIWVLDVASGKNSKIDTTIFGDPTTPLEPHWSPDSKWIAYNRDLLNHYRAIFLYNVETEKSTQITDGLASARSPIFDRDGKHLYFYASTNLGQASSWLDLSSYNNPNVTSSVYAVVLRKDLPNPLSPQSDEEPIKEDKKPDEKKPEEKKPDPAKPSIDLDQIENRIIALPMPELKYEGLEPGPAGTFFAMTGSARASATSAPEPSTLWKFSLADRALTPFATGIGAVSSSSDGTKLLIQRLGSLSIVSAMAPPAPGQGALSLAGLQVKLDPKVEWNHMFHEIWRNEKTLLYDPNVHGIDVQEMDRRYAPFLANIESRDDLNYLFTDMLGEVSIGHMFPGGGDIPGSAGVPGGLLGIDYSFDNGHYRITRVYDGERWNPGLYAPLAQPGINAKVGEYVLAVDGKDLLDSNDIYETLEGKAGKQVQVKLGPTPDGKDSRTVTVIPVPSEFGLRNRAWEEDNRRLVEKMTNGRGGYVHVPDTNSGGWDAFNRYYYAQVGKDGLVVDERFNHGGLINDFMIREMKKPLDAAFVPRDGQSWPTPGAAIFGPKVMMANQFSGSGGDMFPWLFRHEQVGPIVGKRTWGGLIAAASFPTADGGRINAPNYAFYNLNGTWDVENYGVDPDIDVELDPYLWRQGRDSQLEKAIEELNKRLASYKPVKLQHPPYPDKTKLNIHF